MTTRTFVGLTSVWILAAMTLRAQQPATPPAQPTFRAATELIAIDATVVGDRGEPVGGLTPEDFVLTIDGAPRRVVSAQFIKQDPPGPPPTLAGRRLPFSTNESAVGGRLVLTWRALASVAVGGPPLPRRVSSISSPLRTGSACWRFPTAPASTSPRIARR